MRSVAPAVIMGGMSATSTYLSELDAALVGPARDRRDLVQEAADHLEDATEAYERAGYPRDEAEQRAAADFGTVGEVAPGFQITVALASARRTAWILFAALAIQPFLWDGSLDVAGVAHASEPDTVLYGVLDTLVEVGGFLALLGTVSLLLLTTVAQRRVRIGRPVALLAGWFTIGAAVVVPLLALAMTALSGHVTLLLAVAVLLLMIAPLGTAALSARRTLAAC